MSRSSSLIIEAQKNILALIKENRKDFILKNLQVVVSNLIDGTGTSLRFSTVYHPAMLTKWSGSILAVNWLKQRQAGGIDGFTEEFFITTPEISAYLIRKS